MSDDNNCPHCGTSWDETDKHARVCLIGESALLAERTDIKPPKSLRGMSKCLVHFDDFELIHIEDRSNYIEIARGLFIRK
jgi:hypothetical protein